MKIYTVERADSFGANGFGCRQLSTKSATVFSPSEAYPRASIAGQRLKIYTAERADSLGPDGFGCRQLSTESATIFSSSEAYPRASIAGRGGRCRWSND